MKLVDIDLRKFGEVLASDAPAPGGGSIAALMGALGAGLTAMVARLTKADPTSERTKEIIAEADQLRVDLTDAIDKDTDAFMLVSNAFSMPKETDEEKAARSAAIQAGLVECTESPLNMMVLMNKAIDLTVKLSEDYNKNAASDLGVSALSIEAGIKGAYYNVLINVGSLKDKEKAQGYREKAEGILAEVIEKAKAVQSMVEETIA